MNDAHIEALLAEYAAYMKAGLPERVAQVEFELARYGIDPNAKPVKPTKKGAA
jgi:hypothetical protein